MLKNIKEYKKNDVLILSEMKKKNNLELIYLEDFLEKYNKDRGVFTFDSLVLKLECLGSLILGNGHLEPMISYECLHEKLSRHFLDKK